MNLADKVAKGIDKIVLLATKKAIDCQEHVLLTLQAAPHMDLGRLRTRHILTVATLRILALNVKESTSLPLMFVQEDDENIPPTPCVLYSGQDLEDADFFHLVVDRERLFSVPNAEEGLSGDARAEVEGFWHVADFGSVLAFSGFGSAAGHVWFFCRLLPFTERHEELLRRTLVSEGQLAQSAREQVHWRLKPSLQRLHALNEDSKTYFEILQSLGHELDRVPNGNDTTGLWPHVEPRGDCGSTKAPGRPDPGAADEPCPT
ncbi:uncharacterized protein ISCGN_002011 [Ixodes scapularis]